MTRFLHSNWMFAVTVGVMLGWAVTLLHPRGTVKIIECPYRVSARGIIHTPDSPFWGLTARDPCFRTEAAAREYAGNQR